MAKKVQWLPIVSNPEVLNSALSSLNPIDSYMVEFCDVYGVDPDLLSMVPQPCFGVMLLFPLTETYKKAKEAEQARIEKEGQTVSPRVYFMRQRVGNACGTIALMHSVYNNPDTIPLAPESALDKFLRKTGTMTPEERADSLGTDEAIAASHDAAAHQGTDSNEPFDTRVDTHFIAFVPVDGHLYELDGRKLWPINHGPTSQDTFLADAARVIKTKFMDLDPTDLRFNIMALAAKQW